MFNIANFPTVLSLPDRLTSVNDYHPSLPAIALATALVRPSVAVELGVYRGDSLCTVAQSCRELGLKTRIYGVDTFKGDANSGFYSEEILTDLQGYIRSVPYDNVHLIRSTLDEARPKFDDIEIDLLHIDAGHGYEEVKHDYETWLPRMSSRGVILFHDTHLLTHPRCHVWKFWGELKEQYQRPNRWFEFPWAWGVGLIQVGHEMSPGMSDFLALQGDDITMNQTFIRHIGHAVVDHFATRYQMEQVIIAGFGKS